MVCRVKTYDILCGIVYIPPYGTRYSVEDPFFEIENELRSLSVNYSCIAMFGDYNSRTKNLCDRTIIDSFLFEHLNCDEILNEYDIESQHFINSKITTERLNSDLTINAYGYKMLEFCKNNCIYCINGRCVVDPNIGKCTSKGVSTIDYFLTTPNLFP